MARAFFGAYWGPRAESVDQCAERIARLIPALGAIDDLLTGWHDEAEIIPNSVVQPIVTTAHQDLVERLKIGIARDDIGEVMDTLGYSVYWQNKSNSGRITLHISLGVTSKLVSNLVIFQFPDPIVAPSIYSTRSASALVSTIIDIFQPDRAVWLDDDSHAAQKEPDRISPIGGFAIGKLIGHPAGWATYLADSEATGFDRNLLPATASTRRVSGGTLVFLGDDPAKPAISDVLALRLAMGYEVPPQSPHTAQSPPSSTTSALGVATPASTPQPASGEANNRRTGADHGSNVSQTPPPDSPPA